MLKHLQVYRGHAFSACLCNYITLLPYWQVSVFMNNIKESFKILDATAEWLLHEKLEV